ncbi:MAG: methyltransferase domain-containing protein [Sulfurimonas sp.]|nr:methyltransferase domain-containing protein [Sulfurimonas sp.]
MHASSLENMQKAYERYIKTFSWKKQTIDVIDIGGANVNGSYADIFSTAQFNYKAVDIYAGEGVDVVLEDPYVLPFKDNSIDIIISGQAFEHVEYFWKLFSEFSRVLAYDGFIILIAPSAGPIHKYPVDCYRFYPDAYAALAKLTHLHLVDVWRDTRGPWDDLVGVFTKDPLVEKYNFNAQKNTTIVFDINRYEKFTMPAFYNNENAIEGAEKIKGDINYIDVIQKIHDVLNPKFYLEIGVRFGRSLKIAKCDSIGIDPVPDVSVVLKENHKLFKMTSDDFFEFCVDAELKNRKIDLAFIDGMHLFEFVLRDFINIEKYASSNTVVIIDDVNPNHSIQASRERKSRVWTGDVWKIKKCLEKYRPDLNIVNLDTLPTGLLVISNLKPNNKVLEQKYNPIVREFTSLVVESENDSVITRADSINPEDKFFWQAMLDISNIKLHNVQIKNLLNFVPADLSVIVINYNMSRELPKTLYTLQSSYQRDIKDKIIEIIVVDNGSTEPIEIPVEFTNVKLILVDFKDVSPAKAINIGIKKATSNLIGVMIDGARMASPGIFKYVFEASKISKRPIVSTLGFHLGHDVQMKTVSHGYNQEFEDKLLDVVDWKNNGYELFNISVFAGSSAKGWFWSIAESNALFMTKEMWSELDGYDEEFKTPGGGLVNLDTYARALELPNSDFFTLLGEGTFHQVHGGIATNSKQEDVQKLGFHSEYKNLRGKNFQINSRQTQYLGSFHKTIVKNRP